MTAEPEDTTAEPEPSAEDDAEGPEAPEAWEAFEQFRALAQQLLGATAGGANLMGTVSAGGDVVAGGKQVLHFHAATDRARTATGPLRSGELAATERTFAATRRYDEAHGRLKSDQVLVLRGHWGTGRRTAAVRLLAQLSARSEVIALDPDGDPARIGEQLSPGCGHLLSDPVTGREAPLRAAHLHAVRKQLAEQGGLLIVTTDPEAAYYDVPAVDWQPPDPTQVVRAHLAARLEDDGFTGVDAHCTRLVALPEVAAYLRSGPTPREAAGLAGRLHAHAAGRMDTTEVTAYGRAAALAVVDEWFGEAGPHLRDKAFLIALAVLNGSPYPQVTELGDQLYQRLRAVERPSHRPGLRVFAASPRERLQLARAHEYEGTVESPWGRLPQRLVAFRGEEMGQTVLAHVWMSHPAVRAPMTAWLRALAVDRRAAVRLRAAVAVGTVATADFAFAHDTLISPWAASARPGQRQLAAWALTTCGEGEQQTVVRRLLNSWSREGGSGRRWTAARTHALLGVRLPEAALRDLALIADRSDDALRGAVVQSLVTLLRTAAAPRVLAALCAWSEPGHPLRPTALKVLLQAAGSEHDEPGDGLPALLGLARHDTAAVESHTLLWRRVLADREARRDGLDRLGRWITASAGHDELDAALTRLLPALVVSENDAERLEHLVRRRTTPGDASSTSLLGAVQAARHSAGRASAE
ncbi:hypothetical protein [Kitasatospora sp. McL0602]|uniref:hypothetical protein n=1 Tax=Kitasatospora sp. McL0602 TaxID=3439530 RepID=UPI003F8AA21F